MKKIVISSVVISTLLLAVDADNLVTHTELGYIQTSGNTETETFNLDAKVKKAYDLHSFSLSLDAQYAKDGNVENKNKFATELNYGYNLGNKLSFGYLAGYKKDKFSNYDYQFYTGPSLKYNLIETELHKLNAEGSILISKDDIINTTDVNEYAAYRAKGVYEWKILENLKFDQELGYRGSFEDSKNYFINSKSALTSKFTDMFSAGISYKIDYVNLSGDKEHSDKTFSANLIIDY